MYSAYKLNMQGDYRAPLINHYGGGFPTFIKSHQNLLIFSVCTDVSVLDSEAGKYSGGFGSRTWQIEAEIPAPLLFSCTIMVSSLASKYQLPHL